MLWFFGIVGCAVGYITGETLKSTLMGGLTSVAILLGMVLLVCILGSIFGKKISKTRGYRRVNKTRLGLNKIPPGLRIWF